MMRAGGVPDAPRFGAMATSVPPPLRRKPFRTADARAAGLERHHLRGQRFRPLLRDVYVSADVPETFELWCDAARLVTPPEAVFSYGTAAQLYSLPLPPALVHPLRRCNDQRRSPGERTLHLTVDGPSRSRRRHGLVIHQSSLPADDVRDRHGRPLTSAARTFLDLAEELTIVDLVVLGDAMLNRRLVALAAVTERVEAGRREPGVVRAREAVPLLEPRAQSPAESKVRLHIVLAGLPRPEANVDVFDEAGQWVACPDLLYREQRVAIEYDGEHHYTDAEQRREDVERNQQLRDLGFEVVILNAVHLRQPHRLVARVSAALSRNG